MKNSPQKTQQKSSTNEAETIMEKYRKTSKQLTKKQNHFKMIDTEEERNFAVFTSVMSGFAFGSLSGIIAEQYHNFAVEEPHGTEIGFTVGATVCTLGIVGHILRRKQLLKQIDTLEKQQANLLKEFNEEKTKTKTKDEFIR